MDLREKIARALFAHETHGLRPPDVALDWDSDGHCWFGFADAILAIPEIKEALEAKQPASNDGHGQQCSDYLQACPKCLDDFAAWKATQPISY